jgi:hypothetical protein
MPSEKWRTLNVIVRVAEETVSPRYVRTTVVPGIPVGHVGIVTNHSFADGLGATRIYPRK